jgi:hypothetical protein
MRNELRTELGAKAPRGAGRQHETTVSAHSDLGAAVLSGSLGVRFLPESGQHQPAAAEERGASHGLAPPNTDSGEPRPGVGRRGRRGNVSVVQIEAAQHAELPALERD